MDSNKKLTDSPLARDLQDRLERAGSRLKQDLEDGTVSQPPVDTSAPSPHKGKNKKFNDRAQSARQRDASAPH